MPQTYMQLALFPDCFTDDHFIDEELADKDTSSQPLYQDVRRILHLLQTFISTNQATRKQLLSQMKDFYTLSDDDLAVRTKAQVNADRKFREDIRFLESLGYRFKTFGKGMQTRYTLVADSGPGSIFSLDQSTLATLALLHTSFIESSPSQQSPNPSSPTTNNPFAQDILALINSIISKLSTDQRTYFQHMLQKPRILLHLHLAKDYTKHRATINTIVEALELQRWLDFDYASSNSQSTRPHHDIDPQHIEQHEGHLYLIGYHTHFSQYLEYRLDRIHNLSSHPSKFQPLQPRRLHTFTYWADDSLVKDGISHRWLSTNILKQEPYINSQNKPGKRHLIEATAYSEWRIIQQLLKYGPKVELVGPDKLRQLMAQELQKTSILYYQPPPTPN
jgi:hypothetical protein